MFLEFVLIYGGIFLDSYTRNGSLNYKIAYFPNYGLCIIFQSFINFWAFQPNGKLTQAVTSQPTKETKYIYISTIHSKDEGQLKQHVLVITRSIKYSARIKSDPVG